MRASAGRSPRVVEAGEDRLERRCDVADGVEQCADLGRVDHDAWIECDGWWRVVVTDPVERVEVEQVELDGVAEGVVKRGSFPSGRGGRGRAPVQGGGDRVEAGPTNSN